MTLGQMDLKHYRFVVYGSFLKRPGHLGEKWAISVCWTIPTFSDLFAETRKFAAFGCSDETTELCLVPSLPPEITGFHG